MQGAIKRQLKAVLPARRAITMKPKLKSVTEGPKIPGVLFNENVAFRCGILALALLALTPYIPARIGDAVITIDLFFISTFLILVAARIARRIIGNTKEVI